MKAAWNPDRHVLAVQAPQTIELYTSTFMEDNLAVRVRVRSIVHPCRALKTMTPWGGEYPHKIEAHLKTVGESRAESLASLANLAGVAYKPRTWRIN
jgi:hypothetical protein